MSQTPGDARDPRDPLVASLSAAVEALPDDVPLRLHLASVLLDAGRAAEATAHLSRVLTIDPTDAQAISLLRSAAAALAPGQPSGPLGSDVQPSAEPPAAPVPASTPTASEPPTPTAPTPTAADQPAPDQPTPDQPGFDWAAAESAFEDVDHPYAEAAFDDEPSPPPSAFDVEAPDVTLADVGGMGDVKRRLDVAFLTPMRNPALREAFGKSLRGGLLLYGPPGCGKTFVARALAGELGARFLTVSLADVLDMYIGSSERNVQGLFRAARQAAPCVLFLDELDALGQKRTNLRGDAQRGAVNQLLTELDGVGADNEGVFVLAASNAPWDIDAALRRPGRLDRTLLVLPPDLEARQSILRYHLQRRPVSGINVGVLAKQTEHYSGADLAHVVETGAEYALEASIASGEVRPITMKDLSRALREVKPSTGAWFGIARNVAEFANEHGEYDELMAYLRSRRMV